MVDSQRAAQIVSDVLVDVSDVSVIILNLTARDSFASSLNICLRKLENGAADIGKHCK